MYKKIPLSATIYAWIVWLLAASFFYYKYLVQVSPGVMTTELMCAFSLTGAGLGHLAACFFYGYLLMQIPVGILMDRWNPGKIIALAAGFCALSVFLFSNSFSLTTASLSRFFMGLSAAFAAVGCFKIVSIWFEPKRFAFMAGLSMTAAMFGAVGGQAPLSLLVIHFGWRHALEIVAFAGLILSCLIWIVIRDKVAGKSFEHVAQEDKIRLSTKLAIILTDKQTWLLSLYSGLAFAPVSVFGGLWGVSFLVKAYQLQVTQAANEISLIFIGFAVGCPLAGWFSDYLGRRKPIMAIGSMLALVSLTAVLYCPLPLFYLPGFLFLFGVGASCFFLCFSMVKEIHPLVFTGTVLGFMNTFDSICEAVTEPLIGKFLDLAWTGGYENGVRSFSLSDYHYSLLALSIYLGTALFLLCFIKETYCSPQRV